MRKKLRKKTLARKKKVLREKIATEKKGGDKTVSSDNTGGDPAGRNYLQCCLNHLLIFLNPPAHLLAC